MCGSALITERAAVWRTDNVAREPLSGIIIFVALILPVMPGRAAAAPVAGEIFPLRQPDGSTIDVRIWGDEFYRVVESLDGYTLVRDPKTGAPCYARLSPDGDELVSTGISVGSAPRTTLDLDQHLRIKPASARAKITEARARFADDRLRVLTELGRRTDPIPACQGNVKGIVLLVDFNDEPGIVPPSEVDDYCNQVGYNGYGNSRLRLPER